MPSEWIVRVRGFDDVLRRAACVVKESTPHGMDARPLTDADVEAIAVRVAHRLGASERAGELIDTAGVASMLGLSPEWVRDHAGGLGALRVGDGPRGQLRFDPRSVRQALERRRVAVRLPAPLSRRAGRRQQPGERVELIEFKDRAA